MEDAQAGRPIDYKEELLDRLDNWNRAASKMGSATTPEQRQRTILAEDGDMFELHGHENAKPPKLDFSPSGRISDDKLAKEKASLQNAAASAQKGAGPKGATNFGIPTPMARQTVGQIGRTLVPGVAEAEAILVSIATAAGSHASTVSLTAPLLATAEALPVAAGAGAVGAIAGGFVRDQAREAGASEGTAKILGLGEAVIAGAAIGSVIPGVGTAVGAGIGALLAGGLYLWQSQ